MSEAGANEKFDADDTAPGRATTGKQKVLSAALGLGLAVMLTGASFYCVHSSLIWGPAIISALIALAIAQIGVHLVFFLHLSTSPDNTNNALALAFGVLIVALVVGGSIWIMDHLNQNMIPMDRMMQMQR